MTRGEARREGSADGEQWAALGTSAITTKADMAYVSNTVAQRADGPYDPSLRAQRSYVFADLRLDSATPARVVRLVVLQEGTRVELTELAELSLFE